MLKVQETWSVKIIRDSLEVGSVSLSWVVEGLIVRHWKSIERDALEVSVLVIGLTQPFPFAEPMLLRDISEWSQA